MFDNAIIIEGHSQQTLSVSSSAAETDVLAPGTYAMWSDVDCYIKQHQNDASDVTTSTGFKITANDSVMPVRISRPSKIGAIAGSNGTLSYHKIAQ